MSSSVFFRFKSSKEPSMVTFDGTGISVFELKREIITISKLGDGTDFELVITSEDGHEVYDDDTSIIPRGTTVIARRLPAAKSGRGGAARYVSGKMPQNAKNTHRAEASTIKTSPTPAAALAGMNGAQTEEEKVAAMFKMGADQWAQQQQEMSTATPVHRAGPNKGKSANVPDHPPPSGYVCYRCGEKDHWIQACPTNNNPAFDGRQRVKRTTGIPRSFLKTVEKPTTLVNDGTVDDTKQPPGVMVNAEGEWVIAEPDKAAWDQYQAKAKFSAAAQKAALLGSKELQDRGLECSIDKHLFVDPTKTPCCQKTFCHDCITNALLENDLRCPECSTDNIPIDDLKPDEPMVAKIRNYEEEKAAEQVKKEGSKSPRGTEREERESTKSPSTVESGTSSSPVKDQKTDGASLKRPADSELENRRTPPGPSSGDVVKQASDNSKETNIPLQKPASTVNSSTSQQFPFQNANFMMPGMNGMAFPDMNNFMGMSMSLAPMMGMNSVMANPMMMPDQLMNNGWNMNMWSGFPQQNANMNGNMNGFQNGMFPNSGYNQQNPMGNSNYNYTNVHGMGINGMGGNGQVHGMGINGMGGNGQVHGQGRGNFANQQRTTFSAPSNTDEDSAYFRKPVNPHRHQGRRNVQRPTDYREI